MHVGRTKKEQSNLQHVYLLFSSSHLWRSDHTIRHPAAFLTSALSSARHPKLQCNTVHPGGIPTCIPIHLSSQGDEAGPTMCSTSRAVYLLIASLTIVHNNQLRHCQRNTHSWRHARREVRAGCSSSSLLHRRQESGDKQRVNEAAAAVLKKTAFKGEEAQNQKLTVTLSLTPSLG